MTDKHIPASKLLALINEYDDSVHDLPQAIRALIDEAPEVEIFGYVSDTTYSVTDAGTVRKTPNDIFKNPVFVEPPPSPDLTKLVGELVEALGELLDASKGVIIDARDGRAPLFQLQSSQRKAESLLTRAKEYLK